MIHGLENMLLYFSLVPLACVRQIAVPFTGKKKRKILDLVWGLLSACSRTWRDVGMMQESNLSYLTNLISCNMKVRRRSSAVYCYFFLLTFNKKISSLLHFFLEEPDVPNCRKGSVL